jgi:SAM-dependent methyltransferase
MTRRLTPRVSDTAPSGANIVYRTDQIARYFSSHRVKWEQFYPSERAVIEQLGLDSNEEVLDIGCGCGGLGLALGERFGVTKYSGVEISPPAVDAARRLNPRAQVHQGDILDVTRGSLKDRLFDTVFSLSCVDWNVRFGDMLSVAWQHVRPGGHLVATFRLTTERGRDNILESYQFVNYDGELAGERASYVVLNARDLAGQIRAFDPATVVASGYWGTPSPTAVTPYARLCFVAVAIRKRTGDDPQPCRLSLDLPTEVRDSIEAELR